MFFYMNLMQFGIMDLFLLNFSLFHSLVSVLMQFYPALFSDGKAGQIGLKTEQPIEDILRNNTVMNHTLDIPIDTGNYVYFLFVESVLCNKCGYEQNIRIERKHTVADATANCNV